MFSWLRQNPTNNIQQTKIDSSSLSRARSLYIPCTANTICRLINIYIYLHHFYDLDLPFLHCKSYSILFVVVCCWVFTWFFFFFFYFLPFFLVLCVCWRCRCRRWIQYSFSPTIYTSIQLCENTLLNECAPHNTWWYFSWIPCVLKELQLKQKKQQQNTWERSTHINALQYAMGIYDFIGWYWKLTSEFGEIGILSYPTRCIQTRKIEQIPAKYQLIFKNSCAYQMSFHLLESYGDKQSHI